MRANQLGSGEDIEMKRKSRPRNVQALRYFPSRKAVRGMTHEQPENVQACFLSQSSERIDGL